MTVPIQIAYNATTARLFNADRPALALVSDMLSFLVIGHEFAQAFKQNTWDGRSTFFSYKTQTFPAGFVHVVHAKLTQAGYHVHLVRNPAPAPLGPETPRVDEFGNDDPRYDYQLQALSQVERHQRGIIQVATGGGKSKIAKLIAARYRRMTLFLTTRGVLMHQMKAGFEQAGLMVGVIGDGEFAPVRGVNVGMVQTFVAHLEEPSLHAEVLAIIDRNSRKGIKLADDEVARLAREAFERKERNRARTIKLLEMFEVVIGEEAHEAGGNSYFSILQHCRNAHIRVALTATPFMRDSHEDNMRLMAAFGPILLQVSEKTLIERGILAKPIFKFVTCEPHEKLRKTSPWERAYTLGYVENPNLAREVVADALKAARYGLPVLTLVVRKRHGHLLRDAMIANGLRALYIHGEDDQVGRKRALDALGAGEIDVVIGTNILDVGVDVPSIGLVQLAGGYKGEVTTRQRIGRGLRAKKPPLPNVVFIADYTPALNSILLAHARQRRLIVESTPGFREGILPAGHDFPWTLVDPERISASSGAIVSA